MADILIRGMEMPRDCRECPFNVSIYTYDGGDETCALNAWDGYSEQPKITRHPDCPLLPLPEGHGDLIDRDALKKRTPMVIDYSAGGFGTDGSIRPVRGYGDWQIDQSPTIVPAEGGTENG